MKTWKILSPGAVFMACILSWPADGADAVKPAQKDVDAIQGSWTMVFAAGGGRQLPAEEIANHKLVFRGDKYTLCKQEDKIHDHGSFRLEPTASPRAIDIMEDQGPNKGTTNRGIYLLDGDTLIVCYNQPGLKRPTEFSSRTEGSIFLFIYKRDRR